MRWVGEHRWKALGLGLFVAGSVVSYFLLADTPAKRARSGREAADRDWNEHKARYFVRSPYGFFEFEHRGCRIGSIYHPESGLRTGLHPAYLGGRHPEFHDAYNARIDELVAQGGRPNWAPSQNPVSPEELIAALTQKNLTLVDGYPYNVNLEIGYSSNPFGNLDFFVGRLAGRPELVLVRGGNRIAIIRHEKGEWRYWVERPDEPSSQE